MSTFSSVFNEVFDIGYGQLCYYLDIEDIFSMFQVNKECAETVIEFLKNYKPNDMPFAASFKIDEDSYIEMYYNFGDWHQSVRSTETPTFVTFFSEYEPCDAYCGCLRCQKLGRPRYSSDTDWDDFDFTEAHYFDEPYEPTIKYYIKIEQKGPKNHDTTFLRSLNKEHYYSLMMQYINLRLKNVI